MKRVSVRQLLREPKKYLSRPDKFIVTHYGKPYLVFTIETYDLDAERTAKGIAEDVKTIKKSFKPDGSQGMCKADGCYFKALKEGYCRTHWEKKEAK